MRRFLLVAVMCGAASGAQAADMPDLPFLRGSFTDGLSSARVNWGAVYVGGQARYGAADMEASPTADSDLLASSSATSIWNRQFNYRKWPLLATPTCKAAASAGSSATTRNGTTSSSVSSELHPHGNFVRLRDAAGSPGYSASDGLRHVQLPHLRRRVDEAHRLRLAAHPRPATLMGFPALCVCRPRAGAGEHRSQGRS